MGLADIASPPEFRPWPKIARLNRNMVITEKLDGTNACVVVTKDEETGAFSVYAQSRKRIITPQDDNYGFARWVADHIEELVELGEGYHYGEWWGQGIQRGYGLDEKRFSLFNVGRWRDRHDTPTVSDSLPQVPECCYVVPTLLQHTFDTVAIENTVEDLAATGSVAAPGFEDPEGVVVYQAHARQLYKVTIENDEKPKGTVSA